MRVALAGIVGLSCLLSAGSWHIYTNTWDEPEHLAAGVELLDKGHYEYDTEHPPLARVFIAIGPYLAGARSFGTPPPDGTQEGKDILYSDGHYDRYLTLARAGTLPFLVLLFLATWLWAHRLFESQAAALLAVAFLASVPPILGHAALATLDVAAAATMMLALYSLENWMKSGRWEEAVLFGFTSGIAVATKFSAVPFIGLSLVVLGLVQALNSWRITWGTHEHHPWRVASSRAAGVAMAGLAALVPLLAVYAVRAPDVSGVEVRYDWAVNYLLTRDGLDHAVGSWLSHSHSHAWLPRELTDLFNGVIAVKAHNDAGHYSYLLGTHSTEGWWYFYFVTLAVKTPLPLLAAGTAGLAWLARNGWRERNGWALAPAVLVLAILAFACLFSRINIGIRHVLILYPFLALGAAYVTWRAWEALRGDTLGQRAPRRPRAGMRARTVAAEHAVACLPRLPAVLQRERARATPRAGGLGPRLGPGPEATRAACCGAWHPAAAPGVPGNRRPRARAAAARRNAQTASAGERLGGDLRTRAYPPGG